MPVLEKLRFKIYEFFGNLDIYTISDSRKIQIDWVLEAGCHDGTDTKALAEHFQPKKYFAFEPDEVARRKAQLILLDLNSYNVELSHKGLSNAESSKFLKYAAEGKGSGSTSLTDSGEVTVDVCRFDDEYEITWDNGLLWLDVEGHTVQALEGMHSALEKVVLARVEVQLHTRGIGFTQDFTQVVNIMKSVGLAPLFGPIHPGYFGDIIFVKRERLSNRDKIRSSVLKFAMYFFHLHCYPFLKKPAI